MLTAAAPGSKVLVDTRTAEDTRELFGGDYPGGVLYAPTPWVEANKDTTGKIAAAVVETLHWIKDHSSAEIVGSDKAAYISALDASRAIFLETGTIDPEGAEAVLAVFAGGNPDIAAANVDVTKGYDNSFARPRSDARQGAMGRPLPRPGQFPGFSSMTLCAAASTASRE